MKLYEIADEYQEALASLEAIDGLSPEVIEDSLSAIKVDAEAKALSVGAHYQNMLADIAAMKEAEKRMSTRRKALENQANNFRDYLRDNMQRCGITKIESPEIAITLKKPPKVVAIESVDNLTSEYTKVTVSADRVKIKKALEAGEDIPGCTLEDGAPGLMFR